MTERRQPTPEISVDPAEALRGFKQNPCFENRLMATFVEQKAVAGQIKASQRGDTVTVVAPIDNSPLSFRLVGSNDTKYWRLSIQNLRRNPDPESALASVYRQNMIGIDDYVGALEGGYHGGLSHPEAAEVIKLIAELSDMDRQTRNIRTILEGYPAIIDPVAQAYIKLIGDFTDPARLRVSEEYVKDPPSRVAGIIDDPRLHMTSNVVLNLYDRDVFPRDKSAFCYVHWSGDKGEEFEYPRQTVFGFDPEKGFSYAEGTFNLKPRTVRKEISDRMLASLNEGVVAPSSPSKGLGVRLSGFLFRPQQA